MIAVALIACRPSTGETASSASDRPTESAQIPIDISGSWRLASFDGRALDATTDHDILMLATSRSLRASSQCIQFWRRYSLDQQGLRIADYSPVLMCARGLTGTETAFGEALSDVNTAERIGNDLVLTGDGHRLVFAPGPSVEPVDLTGRWNLRTLNGQTPGANEAVVLSFDGSTMTATSGCMRAAWAYEQVGGAVELTPSDIVSCERTRTAWEAKVFDILDQVSTAVPVSSEQLLLNGSIGQMELDRLS